MRYTTEMYQKNNGSITYGRVLNYDHMCGYGFIRTEEGADLFLSSYNLTKKQSRQIVVGALVSFIPELYGEGYTATHVEVLDSYPAGKALLLPTGETVRTKNLKKMGIANDKENRPFVYFETRKGERFIVNKEDLSKKTDSILEYWNSLKRQFFLV